ncbi:MAG: tRNA (adenosine(37)-N6)-dimethylallyltransferase MiaA [Lentisphaeria bacterium]|nr:tRNA (adenosine(37)-N6)-dimethylallyltransferase MiaA [Lentisphaeria bacterium]
MIIVIMGPTASGKSRLALETARQLNGEIVSFDSMQVYRGLEIGTAQPTADERSCVPHHLVGIYDIKQRLDVYTFTDLAERAVKDIIARGRTPILAGGTGMYLRSFLYGMDDMPGDRELRAQLDELYDAPEREEALRHRMAEIDPAALAKWSECRRRLIRALEVKLISGKSILELQQNQARELRHNDVRAFKLELSPEELNLKIAARTEVMLKEGWIDEAEKAISAGLLETPTAHQALGYKIIDRFLKGEFSREELKEKLIVATRQYARRQRTWFRHQHPEAEAITSPESPLPIFH